MSTETQPDIVTANTKLHGLDHLRALAIFLVFFYHYGVMFSHPAWVQNAFKFGWTGVDLFFVLSGYLIASQLFKTIEKYHSFSLREFFIKRFFRILPGYFFIVAVYFLFPFLREREALAPLWKYLTFTQNIGLNIQTNGTFSHAWSLCIEEQFYLCFPVILLLLLYFKIFKNAYRLIIVFFIAGFFIRIYSYKTFVAPHLNDDNSWVYWHEFIYYFTLCRLDGLLAGVGIAALFQFKKNIKTKIEKHGNVFFISGIFILTIAYFLCLDEQSFAASVFGFPMVSIGYGCMVVAAVCPNCFLYKNQSRATSIIAMLSYAIYLSHKIVIHFIQNTFLVLNKESNWMMIICAFASVMIAWLINIFIERPALKIRIRVLERLKKNKRMKL